MAFGKFIERLKRTDRQGSQPQSEAFQLRAELFKIDFDRFMACYTSVAQRTFTGGEIAHEMWKGLYTDYFGFEELRDRIRKASIEHAGDESLGTAVALGATMVWAALREYDLSLRNRVQFPDMPE